MQISIGERKMVAYLLVTLAYKNASGHYGSMPTPNGAVV
jgi:hypothetical protein